MRLNNKELKIVVDEIYKKVSLPSIEKNKVIMDGIVYQDEYTKDVEEFNKLMQESNRLRELANVYVNKYYMKEDFNGFNFKFKSVPGCLDEYIKFQKQKCDKLLKYPTKEEIEAKIIISGYSEIPEIIERIIASYNE